MTIKEIRELINQIKDENKVLQEEIDTGKTMMIPMTNELIKEKKRMIDVLEDEIKRIRKKERIKVII